MCKIYILGAVGSGKTTLAKKLSNDLNIRYYELDNVVWKHCYNGDIRRNDKEISEIFSEIIDNESWIIENVGKKCFDDGLEKADTIIYLKLSPLTLYRRIFFRWIKPKINLEPSPYKADLKMLKQMYLWAKKEINNSKLKELERFNKKIIILDEKKLKHYKYNCQ